MVLNHVTQNPNLEDLGTFPYAAAMLRAAVPTVRRAKPRKLKESYICRDLSQKRCWDKQPRQGFPGKKGEFSGLGRGNGAASMSTQGNLLLPVAQASCLPSLSARTYGRYNVYLILEWLAQAWLVIVPRWW